MTFSSEGIRYNNQFCTWYYIEYISERFRTKHSGKSLTRDGKGPTAQCWCGNKLYSPCDECSLCHTELRLWVTIKSYPIGEIVKSYWPIPGEKEDMVLSEESVVFNNWCHYTDDWPIEETMLASENWPELATNSETATWNPPNTYN